MFLLQIAGFATEKNKFKAAPIDVFTFQIDPVWKASVVVMHHWTSSFHRAFVCSSTEHFLIFQLIIVVFVFSL